MCCVKTQTTDIHLAMRLDLYFEWQNEAVRIRPITELAYADWLSHDYPNYNSRRIEPTSGRLCIANVIIQP